MMIEVMWFYLRLPFIFGNHIADGEEEYEAHDEELEF